MQRKLGINSGCIRKGDPLQTLKIAKDCGFTCFFSDSYQTKSIYAQKEEAERLGLEFEFIHGPYDTCNDFWLPNDDYLDIFGRLVQTIDAAATAGVKAVIVHVSASFTPPFINDLGFSRYDKLVEYAEKKGVILAFENLRKLGNLAAIMDRYEGNPFVKNCYDCGHEHCFTPPVQFIEIFNKNLYCTHIHDNFGLPKPRGEGDFHLLPFDGDIDYADIIRRLDKIGYTGCLMLEVFDHRQYEGMNPEQFIHTAYERALKLSKL